MAPRQNIAHESGSHHSKQDENPYHPEQLPRRLIRAVVEPSEHVNVNDDEEHRTTVHMDVTDQPAIIDIAHNALNRIEGIINMRGIVHSQNDTRHDHDAQRDARERAKIPKIV